MLKSKIQRLVSKSPVLAACVFAGAMSAAFMILLGIFSMAFYSEMPSIEAALRQAIVGASAAGANGGAAQAWAGALAGGLAVAAVNGLAMPSIPEKGTLICEVLIGTMLGGVWMSVLCVAYGLILFRVAVIRLQADPVLAHAGR